MSDLEVGIGRGVERVAAPGDQFLFAEPVDAFGAICQALGAASVCWTLPPEGVFDSERALHIAETLHERLRAERVGPLTRLGGDIDAPMREDYEPNPYDGTDQDG